MYAGVLTAAFAITVFAGFAESHKTAFDEVDVHRINVVEPDGTLRLVISDKAKFPGSFVNGKEIARPDRNDTGLLFLNGEGTEMGGLTFDGWKDKNGKIQNNGHLSFDQYMQDQVFSLDAGQEGGEHYSVINFSDRGDYSVMDAFEAKKRIDALPAEQRQAEWKKFMKTHPGDANQDGAGPRGRYIRRAENERPTRARPAGHQGGGRRFTEHSVPRRGRQSREPAPSVEVDANLLAI
jgi:hypothetical protein